MIRCLLILTCALLWSGSSPAAVWEPAPSFPDPGSPRAFAAGVDLDGILFVLGGLPSDAQNDATVHRLDPGAGAWSVSPSLEGAVVHAGTGIDGLGRIIIFGGIDRLPAGIYLMQLRAGDRIATSKLVLLN